MKKSKDNVVIKVRVKCDVRINIDYLISQMKNLSPHGCFAEIRTGLDAFFNG